METCENCGRTIGNLETACVHDEHVVCPECKVRLGADEITYAAPAASPSQSRLARAFDRARDGYSDAAATEREAQAKGGVSVVRVLGALAMIAGLLLICPLFPIGLGLLILGGVMVIAG